MKNYWKQYKCSPPRPALIDENNETLRQTILWLLDLEQEIRKNGEYLATPWGSLEYISKMLCRLAFNDPGWLSSDEEIKVRKATLRSAFNASGMLQVDLALKLGISASSLSRSLSEKHPSYCIELTESLCEFLNIEMKKDREEIENLSASLFLKIIEPAKDSTQPVFITNHGTKLAQ